MKRKLVLSQRNREIRPCLFLDRDGVIIKDMHYISNPDEARLMPGIDQIVAKANRNGWKALVITNQSGISRGYFTWQDYDKVTTQTIRLLAVMGGKLDGVYANGFGPGMDERGWRKPGPGMLLEAVNDFNIDIENSILIGDRATDLRAGIAAGIRNIYFLHDEHIDGAGISGLSIDRRFARGKYDEGSPSPRILKSLLEFPLNTLKDLNSIETQNHEIFQH